MIGQIELPRYNPWLILIGQPRRLVGSLQDYHEWWRRRKPRCRGLMAGEQQPDRMPWHLYRPVRFGS